MGARGPCACRCLREVTLQGVSLPPDVALTPPPTLRALRAKHLQLGPQLLNLQVGWRQGGAG